MKRYIRLENGQIHEIDNNGQSINGCGFVFMPDCKEFIDKSEPELMTKSVKIVKKVNTFEKLVKVGDLIKYYDMLFEINEVDHEMFVSDGTLIGYKNNKDLTEIYTKQGKNYILVAEKIEKGWKVL